MGSLVWLLSAIIYENNSLCILQSEFRYFLDDIMGNIQAWGRSITDPPGINPGPQATPTFDPMFGFEGGRKERVMVATEEEMTAANLRPWEKDFCAHKLIEYKTCRNREGAMLYRCHHEKHDWLHCQYEDYIIRAKEFERERRLRMRQQRIGKSMNDEELAV